MRFEILLQDIVCMLTFVDDNVTDVVLGFRLPLINHGCERTRG